MSFLVPSSIPELDSRSVGAGARGHRLEAAGELEASRINDGVEKPAIAKDTA